MAEKKTATRAEKAVSEAKKKKNAHSADTKSAESAKSKAAEPTKQKPVEILDENTKIPGRVIYAVVCLGLFVLFLVMGINPEGAVLKFFLRILLGLIGKVGFYFSIPAILYMFIVIVSSRGQPIRMRCICLGIFVFMSGCVYHLMVNNQGFVGGMKILADLWAEGYSGKSGGVLCGLTAMFMRLCFGSFVSYVVFILVAVFTLLAAMKITIPSIIRAIQNRPRDEWEDEFVAEEKPEPAAMVVNHIANRRIEQKKAKRQKQLAPPAESDVFTEDDGAEFADIPVEVPAVTETRTQTAEQPKPEKTTRLFDVEKTGDYASEESPAPQNAPANESEPKKKKPEKTTKPAAEKTPGQSMPPLNLDDPMEEEPEVVKPDVPVEPVVSPNAKVTASEANESAAEVAAEIAMGQKAPKPVYCFPPIELLKRPSGNVADGTQEMRENSKRLNETLASFKIDAHIVNVTRGPSVTRYEVELDKGVRLNKLTGVADDIALSLGAASVRIAPVPGKISVVGIEVPNRVVTNVNLREVIDSPEFNKSKSKSSFAVGKDIGGTCIVGNIAKMPHLLIAGTTGSGKSVCMNSVIISLLYKASPEEVKLIMVDPKMVELGIYNGIPHLLIPVVTDPKKAAGSLQWAVTEMMRRYKIMSDAGVRDLESYNSMVDGEEVDGDKLPQIVVIIDELADLMLVAAKEVEDSICRIAQMGRAAGMHLIIATQRPSADVITGLMKANIPSRIAFSVASAMESRIILDTVGAEKLVGKGDMLFAPIGTGKPQRVQGCFVTDGEVEAVAGYVKDHYIADYDQQVLEEIEKKAVQTGNKKAATAQAPEPSEEELDGDEMLPAAVDVILETGQASVSMLQRRLKLGYARAARIVDEMEEKGIVGPFQGSKPRAILITKEQWEEKKNGGQMSLDALPFDEDSSEA